MPFQVCDNNSSDTSAEIASAAGAIVVFEAQQQIARARNAGARDARGEWLLFVDADTRPSAALLIATRKLMGLPKCCAAGAIIEPRHIDGDGHVDGQPISCFPRTLVAAWNLLSRVSRVACGAYILCRRDVFQELNGFNTQLYAAEELDFSWRIRRWGAQHGMRMEIITAARLHTSMRKLHLYSPLEVLGMMLRAAIHPQRALRSRRYLDHWYDGRR